MGSYGVVPFTTTQDEEKNPSAQIVRPKIFILQSKTLSRYHTNILLHGLKFTPTSKRNNIEFKSNIENYTRRLQLAEFFQAKKIKDPEKIFFPKQSTFTPPLNVYRDLNHQIDVLNNINLEKMDTKLKKTSF